MKRPAGTKELQDWNEVLAIVSPKKKSRNTNDSAPISADALMEFPIYPRATCRELINHIDFVDKARKKDGDGVANNNLKTFLAWVGTPEGKMLERDNERFVGQCNDETFRRVAALDPANNSRHVHMRDKSGDSPKCYLATNEVHRLV